MSEDGWNVDIQIVQKAYDAYRKELAGTWFLPEWDTIPVAMKNGWIAAVRAVRPINCPHGTPDTHACFTCNGAITATLKQQREEIEKLNYAIMDRDTRTDFERGERHGEDQTMFHMKKPDILEGNSRLSELCRELRDKWLKEENAEKERTRSGH